jgi:hypothetical protein
MLQVFFILQFQYEGCEIQKLMYDHIPSSCIVVLVRVVKGRQYSAYIYVYT